MSEQTVPELRAAIKELDPQRPTSKLRKAELVTLLAELVAKDNEPPADGLFELAGDVAGEPERSNEDLLGRALQGVSHSLAPVATALGRMAGAAMHKAARDLTRVAWANQVATVRSMGHTVRGQVVDVVLREPGEDGMGRVCLVIQHRQRAETRLGTTVWEPTPAYRRTLHRLVDVQFEPVAS
jgi:hypothetical protein